MEANKEEIAKKYSLLLSSGVRHVTQSGMLAAMEEYANTKLHILQEEYDKLRDETEDLPASLEMWKSRHKFLVNEHAALKEKSENLAIALEAILDTNHDNHERVILKIKSLASDALSSYNSTNNQNENNG